MKRLVRELNQAPQRWTSQQGLHVAAQIVLAIVLHVKPIHRTTLNNSQDICAATRRPDRLVSSTAITVCVGF